MTGVLNFLLRYFISILLVLLFMFSSCLLENFIRHLNDIITASPQFIFLGALIVTVFIVKGDSDNE